MMKRVNNMFGVPESRNRSTRIASRLSPSLRRPLLTLPDLAAPCCAGTQLARDCGLTLIGFVRGSSHTVYAGVTAT